MGALRSGLRIASAAAAASTLLAGSFLDVDAATNPWSSSMAKFNIPDVHGSGVFVDLGAEKNVKNVEYREASGLCPVYNKYINLLQPTTNAEIWPRDFLARVPLKNSPQDTKPLGGGFAMFEGANGKLSPLTLSELEAMADLQRSKNQPNSEATKRLELVQDDHGLCAWWAWVTFVQGTTSQNLNDKYRYPFVWDEEKKVCYLLAVTMQLLEGDGHYCTAGDSSKKLTWYCFHPDKAINSLSYNSAYVRPDHATACPERPVAGVHFGKWSDSLCKPITARAVVKTSTASDCGRAAFQSSSSDNPTKYTTQFDGSQVNVDYKEQVPTLFPSGAFGNDRPKSKGVGLNYANFHEDGTCDIFDTVPDCFILKPGGFAFTALGRIDPATAELPPCIGENSGWTITYSCNCKDKKYIAYECSKGQWNETENPCECEESNLGLIIGLSAGASAALLLLIGAGIYMRKKKSAKPEEEAPLMQDGEDFQTRGRKKKQSDFMQEAEPSFWGENDEDKTQVLLEGAVDDVQFH